MLPALPPFRSKTSWLAAAAAGGLILIAVGFAVAALYLAWREALPAPLAAALTALCLLAIAGVIHLAARRAKPAPPAPLPWQNALPVLQLVRSHPRTSLLGALVVGAVLEQLERRRR
jgi:hypothetical protein